MSTAKHYQIFFCISLLEDPNYFIEFGSMDTSFFEVEVYHSRPRPGNLASNQIARYARYDLTRFRIKNYCPGRVCTLLASGLET